MASLQAIAARRASVVARLAAVKQSLAARFGVSVEEQRVTRQDAALAQIQALENVATLLEAVLNAPLSGAEAETGAEEISGTALDTETDESPVAGIAGNDGPVDEWESAPPDDDEDFALRLTEAAGPTAAAALMEAGYGGAGAIAAATDEDLDAVKGVGPATVDKLREAFTE